MGRVLLSRPERDKTSGKTYVAEVEERFDDCAHQRFQMGSFIRRDAHGDVVYSGSSLAVGWQEIVPGSVAESLARVACAVASPPKEPPIQADLREGAWTDLGGSADGKYRLQVRIDGVRKIENGPVVAVSRSVYAKPEWIEGFAVRYVVTGTAIDCAAGKSASLGADLFISPTVRVKSLRVPEAQIVFQPAGPNSFLANSLRPDLRGRRAGAEARRRKRRPLRRHGLGRGQGLSGHGQPRHRRRPEDPRLQQR